MFENSINFIQKIADLDVIGTDMTIKELTAKLEDEDLIILLLRRNLNDANLNKEELLKVFF